MRYGITQLRRAIRLLSAAMLGAALLAGPPLAHAAAQPSSPQDRQRFVSIANRLQSAPLDPKLASDRDWAFEWLAEAPDIQVNVCSAPLAGWDAQDYRYKSEILYQYIFSMGRYLIENPAKAEDRKAQYLAGVEGALKAYQVILREMPEAKSSGLDTLLDTQAKGGLSAFITKATIECSVGKGRPT